MALGGSNDKLQGSTGGSTVSSSKPSRPTGSRPNSSSSSSSKPINAYQQMAQAAQDANINNLSGTNTTKPAHYSDGSSTGEHNPNGVGGLPSKPSGGSGGSSSKPQVTADKPAKPEKPKPLSAQDQYAQIVDDDYEWWQQKYLPMYYEAQHEYRGGNFDGDLQRANQTTGAAFDAAQSDVERAARGFGVNADIDQVKWDAMEASQKSGNRAALAPRVTQDQLSAAREVNEAGGPGSVGGKRLMNPRLDKALTNLENMASNAEQAGIKLPWIPGMPGGPGAVSDKMAPIKDQWKKDESGFGVNTR